MKLFHFSDSDNYHFAQATRLGTWHPENSKLCPQCNISRQKRVPPLIMEWDPGSDIVGDFIWPGFNDDMVIVQKVKDIFEKKFKGIEYYHVEFWQNPRLKQPVKNNRRSKPRVWLPYDGPTLWDVIPVKWVHLDQSKSGVSEEKCPACGKTIYKRPPWNQRHMVIDLITWDGEDIFRIYEYPGPIFCTEFVKEFVEQSGFTNVKFSLDGEIPTA